MLNSHTEPQDASSSPAPSPYLKISFKGNRRETFENQASEVLKPGEYVIVEADNGIDLGMITPVCNPGLGGCSRGPCAKNVETLAPDEEPKPQAKLLRKASETEIGQYFENRRMEDEAHKTALELVRKNNLEMKLVDVEYQLDRKKITFFYTADERVDFRQLVKDLAHVFRTRIEMRQIGVRDHARRLGGIGPCGQELCCSRFMDAFEPVTTQYAKDQNLPINPSKLSGACGKLKCCLRFEWDFYKEAQKDFPSIGIPVELKTGIGTICGHDLLNQRVNIAFENGTFEVHPLSDIKTVLTQMDARSKQKKAAT